jgi:hypothetical protein
MKVYELIEKLQSLPDKHKKLEVKIPGNIYYRDVENISTVRFKKIEVKDRDPYCEYFYWEKTTGKDGTPVVILE